MAEIAELRLGDRSFELPIIEGSEGERAIDIRSLRSESGYITLDPGYANTGSCKSAVCFIELVYMPLCGGAPIRPQRRGTKRGTPD